MKIIFAALFSLTVLSACEMPQQARTAPSPDALMAPIPARGNGGQDFSRMNNSMEVTRCGYTSLFLYKCNAE